MYTHNANVSIRQAKLLLILQMFNMSMLILPRIAGKIAGHDGYMLPVIGFVIGTLYIWAITTLLRRFPGEGLDTIAPKVLTKGIGFVIVGLYVVKLLVSAGFEVRMFAEMVSQVLLPQTPLPVIILILLFATQYLIKSGIEAYGRMAEVVVYFVFAPLVLIFALVLTKTDYAQLLPMFTAKPQNMLVGAYYVSMTFMPLEFLLITGCLVNKPGKLKSICLWAVGVISVVEILLIALTFTGVGMVTSTKQLWPVLTLMQSIQLPSSFVENQEIFMMCWWIMSIYMYISGAIYVASLTISRVLHFHRQNVTTLPLIPIVFLISMLPSSLSEAYTYLVRFNGQIGIWFLFIVPLVLVVLAKMRKLGGHAHDE